MFIEWATVVDDVRRRPGLAGAMVATASVALLFAVAPAVPANPEQSAAAGASFARCATTRDAADRAEQRFRSGPGQDDDHRRPGPALTTWVRAGPHGTGRPKALAIDGALDAWPMRGRPATSEYKRVSE